MKILIIIKSLQIGGAERQVISDANMLVKNNDVFIYLSEKGKLIDNLNERVKIFETKNNSLICMNIQLLKIIKGNNIEIVMAHMYWAQKVVFLSKLINFNTKNFFFEHGLNLWKNRIHIVLTHILSYKIKAIIVVSEAKRQVKINREKFPKKKVYLIPNCFEEKNIINNSSDKLPFNPNIFTIGFVGRFNAVKQLHILIAVANLLKRRMSNFQFVLVGDGIEMTKVKKLISENNLDNHFILTGYVTNPLSYMMFFNLFVLPSKIEDLSVSLLEAGSLGIPSIAFDVGGNNEIIIDGKTGFIIPPFDIEIFLEKLLILISNTKLAEEFGAKARKHVQKNFSIEKRNKKLSEIIN